MQAMETFVYVRDLVVINSAFIRHRLHPGPSCKRHVLPFFRNVD